MATARDDAASTRFGNYGTPSAARELGLYSQRLDEIYERCERRFDYQPIASAFPSFIMNHFANNSVYDAFKGTDYTPHNLGAYPEHSHWRTGLRPRPVGSRPVVGGLCEVEMAAQRDGGSLQYTLMRVGPFTSNGGYDWWQYAGHDTLKLSRHLSGGRTIGIQSHWVTAVEEATGRPLGYPPMHVHHIHLVPSKPWLRYQWATPATAGWRNMLHHLTTEQGAAYYGEPASPSVAPNGPRAAPRVRARPQRAARRPHARARRCEQLSHTRHAWKMVRELDAHAESVRSRACGAVPNYVMEQHGEWDLCDIREEGEGCFAESLPRGFLNLVDFPLDFEGELNDGREVGAPNLSWYLEIGLGWTADFRRARPLSYAVLTEDHFGMVDGHQHTYENYHWVPSTGEWVNYYTGKVPPNPSPRPLPLTPSARAPLPAPTHPPHLSHASRRRLPSGGGEWPSAAATARVALRRRRPAPLRACACAYRSCARRCLVRTLSRAPSLVRTLSRAPSLVRTLSRALSLVRTLSRALSLVRTLSRALSLSSSLSCAIADAGLRRPRPNEAPRAHEPAAQGLLHRRLRRGA